MSLPAILIVDDDKVLSHVKDTPAVMLTSDRSADVYEESMWLGTVAYVVKPIDYDTLGEALQTALAASRALQPTP
jgi:DNA-binding NarL/FixJ family response regulator